MPSRRAVTLVLAVLAAIGLWAGSARAATDPGRITLSDLSEPNEGQTLAASPAQLSLVFSAGLGSAPGVVLQDAAGQPVQAVAAVVRGDDAQTWYLPLTSTLPAGKYKVSWKAGDSAGTYTFSIGRATNQSTGPAVSTPATVPSGETGSGATAEPSPGAPRESGGSSPQTPKAVNVVARWVSYLAIGALLGGLVLIAATWNDGVEYVLTVRHFRLAWVVAVLATALNVACTRAVAMDATLADSLNPSSWTDLTHDAAGLATLARLGFVVLSAWVAFAPERAVDEATQIPALLAPSLAVATFGFTRATGGIDLLLVPAGVVHGLAFAVWIGGLALLWRVVLAGSGGDDLVDAVRGFGRLANLAMLFVIVSGVLITVKLLGGLGELFSSSFGRLLLLKGIVVAAMAYVGVINRQTVRHRLRAERELGGRLANRLRRAVGSELITGVVVLGLTGWMVGTVPRGLGTAAASGAHRHPTSEFVLGNDGYTATVGIGPATVGTNDLVIDVSKPAAGLVELVVTLEAVDAYTIGIVVPVGEKLQGKGQMIVRNVPLCAEGRWRATATARSISGALGETQATFSVGAGSGAGCPQPEAAPETTTTIAGG